MDYATILYQIETLPGPIQQEVSDFIEFLVKKYGEHASLPKAKKPQFGCLRGTFKMSADFDEPLEDFKEYMS